MRPLNPERFHVVCGGHRSQASGASGFPAAFLTWSRQSDHLTPQFETASISSFRPESWAWLRAVFRALRRRFLACCAPAGFRLPRPVQGRVFCVT